MVNYLHFTIHPEFPTSPFLHCGRPPRADRTPSAQDSHPGIKDCLRNFAQSERAGRVKREQRISTWETKLMPSALKGKYYSTSIFQPLTMERE